MIVATAKGRPYPPHDAKRFPVEPNFRKRGPHQSSDENQVLAVFLAKQFLRPSVLPHRDPMMAEAFGGGGIADAFQPKQNGIKTARLQRFSNGKWHRPAPRDHANRR